MLITLLFEDAIVFNPLSGLLLSLNFRPGLFELG